MGFFPIRKCFTSDEILSVMHLNCKPIWGRLTSVKAQIRTNTDTHSRLGNEMDISNNKIYIFVWTATCRICIDLRLKIQSQCPYIYCVKYHGNSKATVIIMPPFLRRKFKSHNKWTKKPSASFNQRPFLSCLNFVVGYAMEKARVCKWKCSKLCIITIQIS